MRCLDSGSPLINHYIKRNKDKWHAFCEEIGVGASMGDLYFVTGWYKTERWESFTFTRETASVGAFLRGGVPPLAAADISAHRRTARISSPDHFFGPDPLPCIDARAFEALLTSRKLAGPSSDDQCLFLQSVKIRNNAINRALRRLRLKAAAGPHPLPRDDRPDDSPRVPSASSGSQSDEDNILVAVPNPGPVSSFVMPRQFCFDF
jgi:hypothetical protein